MRTGRICEVTLDGFYAPLVVDDAGARSRARGRRYAVDTRLRDRLRALGFGAGAAAASRGIDRGNGRATRRLRSQASTRRSEEADIGIALAARASTDVESRISAVSSEAGSRGFARHCPAGAIVSATWQRLLGFVPTRAAAVVLFVARARRSSGSRRSAGRWRRVGTPGTTSSTTSSSFDADPPISELQLFRDAAHADRRRAAAGSRRQRAARGRLRLPLRRHDPRVERDGAHLRAHSRALHRAVLLLVYPAFATLYHQARATPSSRPGSHSGHSLLARDDATPSGWRFVALGAGIAALVLIRPANQVLLPLALVPLLAARRLAPASRVVAASASERRLALLGGWALHNGVRYDDATVARGGRAWVPFLSVFTGQPDDRARRTGKRRGGSAELIEDEVLAKEPHAASASPLDAYLANGSNYETVRLIALSDRVLGRDANYDVLFDSALEAIRDDPGTYVRGVADTFWEFLIQRPLREDIAPREQTAPEPPAPTFERDGVVLPNPQAHVLVDGVPYGFVWCASDYIDSCTLADPSRRLDDPALQRAVPRGRLPGAGVGRRASVADGVGVVDGDPQPDHAALSAAAALARRRVVALVCAAPRGWRDDRGAVGGGVPRAARSTRRRRASLPSSRCRSIRSSSSPRSAALAGERGRTRPLASSG